MTSRNHTRRPIALALLSLCALAVILMPASLTARAARPASSPIYLTSYTYFHTTMTRNFNPFLCNAQTNLDFTCGAIYEPLIIITIGGGIHTYPWLATGYKWADGNRTLLVFLRHGVRWSDGRPMTASDVAFTFTYGKTYSAADQNGLWSGGHLKSVDVVNPYAVAFHFKSVDTTVLPSVVSSVEILPQHVWSHVKNPGTWTNPNPVGTGPFTQIAKFSGQEYILGKNPYYWQAGRPTFDGIRVPLYTGNDSSNLAMVHGELDWTGTFVPDIQKVYVQKDPVHFHYFYASNQPANGLFFNDQVYPYSLTGFRKALSYAIDRNKLYLIGEYGYEPPSDAIGIAAEYPSWVDKSLEPQAKEQATYNPAKARAMLARLGFTWKGGQLYDPRGHKIAIQLAVISGWSDWVLDCQILQRNFQAIGIDASVKLMDNNSWFDKANKGLLSANLYWTNSGISPYTQFYGYMSKESYVPTGQDASLNGQTNWARWWSPRATQLLAQFRATTDAGTQHAIVDQLQKIQLDEFPYIPLQYAAIWYTYSTRNFTGWVTPSNYYAIGAPYQYPDNAKVLTTITPVK